MFIETNNLSEPPVAKPRSPWDRGKLIGQKPPLTHQSVIKTTFLLYEPASGAIGVT
jgi:hypothetical protein